MIDRSIVKKNDKKIAISGIFFIIFATVCILNLYYRNYLSMSMYMAIALIYAAIIVMAVFDFLYLDKAAAVATLVSNLLALIAVIGGGSNGFSPLWLLLFPSVSYYFLGYRNGSFLNAGVFVALSVMLLVKPIYSHFGYGYTSSFNIRVVILFASTILLAYMIERIRVSLEVKFNLKTAELEYLATHDILTRAKNRTAFNRIFSLECGMALKSGKPLCLVISDLDKFKKINDTYGHLAGDKVLQVVAEVFTRELKNNENMFRWGGEEFAILLADTTLEQASELVEKIRKAVEETEIELETGEIIRITASFGICKIDEACESCLKYADDALYQAKNNGRNMVVISDNRD